MNRSYGFLSANSNAYSDDGDVSTAQTVNVPSVSRRKRRISTSSSTTRIERLGAAGGGMGWRGRAGWLC